MAKILTYAEKIAKFGKEHVYAQSKRDRDKRKGQNLSYAEKQERYGRDKMRDQKRRSYQKHKEQHKAKVYAYRAADKDRWLKQNRDYQRRKQAEDSSYYRKKGIKSHYGITYEEYEALKTAQGGKCPICSEVFSETDRRAKPHIDHCHATDIVRGVLCNLCNVMLGSARDDETILRNAADYLSRFRRKAEGA